MNIQGWCPLGLSGLISLLSKRLSRVFSSITIQKHKFFSTQPSLWSNSHIVHDYWKNHCFDYMQKSANGLMGIPLCVICCFSLVALNVFSLSLIFVSSINMCLSMFLLGFILYGTLCKPWTWVSFSFPKLGKFLSIISSNIFSGPFSLLLLLGPAIMQMLLHLMLSQRSLWLSLISTFLFILFCSSDFYHSVFQLTYLFFGLIYSIYSF